MVRIRCTEDFKALRATIKVIGLGGGGGNAINRMADAGLKDVELIAANTDAQDLRRSKAHVRIQLGEELTGGLGVGGDPEKGRAAALESKQQLKEVLSGADLIFITTGLGGGTGTGAAPVAAEVARELNALTLGFVTRPFAFEGTEKRGKAEMGAKILREYVDTLVAIPNDKIFEVMDERVDADEAFRRVDDVLRHGIQSISDVITTKGEINMDFADVKAIMSGAGQALMGVGEAAGPQRAVEAAREAIASPLLENVTIDGAKGLIVNVGGSRKMAIADIKEAMEFVSRAVSQEAKVKFGMYTDETLGEKLRVTVIATGFPARQQERRQRVFGRLMDGPISRPSAGFGRFEGAPPSGMSSDGDQDFDKPAFMRLKTRKLK